MGEPIDWATVTVEDIKAALETVSEIGNAAIYVFSQADFVDQSREIGMPSAGILYGGMREEENNVAENGVVKLTIDVVLIGDDRTDSRIDDKKEKTTIILDKVRRAIRTPREASGYIEWGFVLEQPVNLAIKKKPAKKGDKAHFIEVLAYVQRYKIYVPLDNVTEE
jgi:hypothetical protein